MVSVITLVVAGSVSARELSFMIHAGGQAEVVETREVELAGESSEIRWAPVSSRLDVDSISFTLPDVAAPLPVSDLHVENPFGNRDALLRHYIGKLIRLVRPEAGDEVIGTLLKVEKGRPAIVRTVDGSLLLEPVGEIALPANPELAQEPTLVGQLAVAMEGMQNVRLRYRTSGLKWEPVYSLVFDEKTGRVDMSGTLLVRNDTEVDFEDAAWRFFATEKQEVDWPKPARIDTVTEFLPLRAADRVSLPARSSARLPLLEARNLPVAVAFVFDPLADGPRIDTPAQKLQRVIFVANAPDAGTVGLGGLLPSGKAKVVRRHLSGCVEALGDQRLDGVAAGKMIEIALGPAPGLTGQRTQTPFVELTDARAQEQEITIRLRNDTPTDVLATVFEHPWGQWEIPASSMDYEQLDNETIRFVVPVPAAGDVQVTYTLRIKY